MLTPYDHLLALLITVGLPLRALFSMRALKAATPAALPKLRLRLWQRAIVSQWTLVLLVGALFYLEHRSPVSLRLTILPTPGLVGVLVGLTTIASIVMRQRGQIATDETLRQRIRERLAPVERLLPRSDLEFRWFSALAVTAGLCEEFLFRGFLLWYLAHLMPPPAAWVVQALLFGLGHAYQGAKGIVTTGIAGAFFSGVVFVSGSLAPAMLIHALMDLHAGDLGRRVLPAEPVLVPGQKG
jgi:membrane protease YdiL (CAAX protease family)